MIAFRPVTIPDEVASSRFALRAVATHAGVLALFGALSVWVTWPLLRAPATHIVPREDAFMNVWHLWWMRHALWEAPQNPFVSPLLHHPLGAELYWHTLSPAKTGLGVALLAAMGPVAAHNVILFGTFVLAGYTAWLLLRYLLRRGGFDEPLAGMASIAGACAFTFSPYHFAQGTSHLNLAAIEGVPLYVYFFLRYLDEGRRKLLWGVALCALYVCWCDLYYLAYVALFSLAWVLADRWSRGPLFSADAVRDRAVCRAAGAAGACALALIPALAPLLFHLKPEPVGVHHGDSDYFADVLGLVLPDPLSAWNAIVPLRWANIVWALAASGMAGNVEEAGYFLGWAVPLLCAFALIRGARHGRRWAGIGAMFLVLSLGTSLHVGGEARFSPVVLLIAGAAILLLRMRSGRGGGVWQRDVAIALAACAVVGCIAPFTAFGARSRVEIPLPYLVFKSVAPLFGRGGMPIRFQFMTTLSLAALTAFAAAHIGRWASRRGSGAGIAAAFLVCVVPIVDSLRVNMPVAPVPALPAIFEDIANAPPDEAVATDHVIGQYEQIFHRHPITFARQSRVPPKEMAYENSPLLRALHRHDCRPAVSQEEQQQMREFLRTHGISYYVAHWLPCDAWIRDVLGGTLLYTDAQRWVYRFR